MNRRRKQLQLDVCLHKAIINKSQVALLQPNNRFTIFDESVFCVVERPFAFKREMYGKLCSIKIKIILKFQFNFYARDIDTTVTNHNTKRTHASIKESTISNLQCIDRPIACDDKCELVCSPSTLALECMQHHNYFDRPL